MKFWELHSVFRSNPAALKSFLEDPRWSVYKGWHDQYDHLVDSQNREILDAQLPDKFCREALSACRLKFIVTDGWLRECRDGPTEEGELTAVDVYNRFGGSIIEEVLEYGSAKVPQGAS